MRKSELKRLCAQDPIGMARKIDELEKELAELRAGLSRTQECLLYERNRLKAERGKVEMLHKLLATSFSSFESGIPCYEGDDQDDLLYIGNAVKFDDETFQNICNALDETESNYLASRDARIRDDVLEESARAVNKLSQTLPIMSDGTLLHDDAVRDGFADECFNAIVKLKGKVK